MWPGASLSLEHHGRGIGDVVDLPVTRALEFFDAIPLRGDGRAGLDPDIAGPILKEVLESKAREGVDIRVLVPNEHNDVPFIRWASHSYYEDLLAAAKKQGVTIEKHDILVVRTGWISATASPSTPFTTKPSSLA